MSSRKNHLWTAADRHMIHIARSEFNLPWDDIARLFEDLFADQWTGTKMPNSAKLRSEYDDRIYPGKSMMWRNVIVKSESYYTEDEKDAREQARSDIESTAAALNIACPNVHALPDRPAPSSGTSSGVLDDDFWDEGLQDARVQDRANSENSDPAKAPPPGPASRAVTRRSAAAKVDERSEINRGSATTARPVEPWEVAERVRRQSEAERESKERDGV